jgi:hypothetical protein
MSDNITKATKERLARERFCYYCGDSMGVYADYDRYDTCGQPKCDREVRDAIMEEREEAHRELDQRNGWNCRMNGARVYL